MQLARSVTWKYLSKLKMQSNYYMVKKLPWVHLELHMYKICDVQECKHSYSNSQKSENILNVAD